MQFSNNYISIFLHFLFQFLSPACSLGFYVSDSFLSYCNKVLPSHDLGLLTLRTPHDPLVCHVVIPRKKGHFLIISVESLHIRRSFHFYQPICSDFVKISAGSEPALISLPKPGSNITGKALEMKSLTAKLCGRAHGSATVPSAPFGVVTYHRDHTFYDNVEAEITYTNAIPLIGDNATCPKTHWRCTGKNFCVERNVLCDSHNNCGNNADENCSSRHWHYFHVSLTVSLILGFIALASIIAVCFYFAHPTIRSRMENRRLNSQNKPQYATFRES